MRQALEDKRREARIEKGRLLIAAGIPYDSESPHLSPEESNQLKRLIDVSCLKPFCSLLPFIATVWFQSFVGNGIPSDINGVTEQIEAETQLVQFEGAGASNKDADEYDDLAREEAVLEQRIQELTDRVSSSYRLPLPALISDPIRIQNENWQGSMDEKLRQWLTPLKDLVAKINEEYARLFQKLGYEGKIVLSVPKDRVCCLLICCVILTEAPPYSSTRQTSTASISW